MATASAIGVTVAVVAMLLGPSAAFARAADDPATPGTSRGSSAAAGTPRHGVAIDLGAIRVDEELLPGEGYDLPPVRVRNPGTVVTSYTMAGRPHGDGLEPPADWFTFSPATFTLAAGDQQLVAIELVVPPGAAEGRYTALLAAQVADLGGGDGPTEARVGAAAATRLEFGVIPASWLSGWWQALQRWFRDAAPWSWLALATAVLAGVLWLLSRRFHLRVERVGRA